jgi:chromosome segregation ATPase
MEWISLLISFIAGGGLYALFTIGAKRRQANAEAAKSEVDVKSIEVDLKGKELDQVEQAVKIWRESAEASEKRYNELYDKMVTEMSKMQQSMTDMESTIKKLTATNNQILKILKEINHDNLEQKKAEAKEIAGA